MNSKSRVHNPKYLEKYFTQFPNIIDDAELTPYEFRLLIHYYRVGECWEGVRKTSEICCMSTGKVAECRHTLEAKGLIRSDEKGDGVIIYLTDLSRQNLEKFTGEGVQEVNTGVQEVNGRCSPHEHKKNQLKKNQLRTPESEDSADQKDLFSEGQEKEPQRVHSKKEKKGAEPFFREFIDVWVRYYREVGLQMPKDGAKIKSLIRQVQARAGDQPSGDGVVPLWEKFVQGLKNTWGHGKNLSTIDSHFNSLFVEIKNGSQKPKQDYFNRNSADRIRSLPEQDF